MADTPQILQSQVDEQKLMDENAEKMFNPAAYAERKKQEEEQLKSQNFQDASSLSFAQFPSPAGQFPSHQTPQIAIDSAIPSMVTNAAALKNQAPVMAPISTGQGNIPVPREAIGTGDLIATPSIPQAPVPTETANQQINTASIVDPFASSNALAMKGIGQAETAGIQKAAAEHAYYQKKADFEQEAMNKQQALQDVFDFKHQEKMDDYNQSITDLKALAGDKVVPSAFLARQDTTGSIMTGMAVALGSIASGLRGTSGNIGLEMIEKAIDKDVAAQQFNMEYKYKIGQSDVQNQSSLLSKMKEKFSDDKSAVLATKLAMVSMVEDKMNQEITRQGGAKDLAVKSQANIARSQIIKQKESIELQLRTAQAAEFEKRQMMAGKDYYNLSNEEALANFGKDADKYVKGYGMSTDAQLAKDFIQKVKPMGDTLRKLKSTMSDIDKLSKFNPSDRQALEAIMTDLQLTLKDEENYKLGVLTGPDMELLQKVTGDPTSFNPLMDSKVRLKQVLKNVEAKFDNKIENYGFVPEAKRAGSVSSKVKIIKSSK